MIHLFTRTTFLLARRIIMINDFGAGSVGEFGVIHGNFLKTKERKKSHITLTIIHFFVHVACALALYSLG